MFGKLVILCAMLPKIATMENASAFVQFVGYRCPINFHAGREDNEIKPLADNGEEKFHMRPQMNEESDWLIVDGHLKIEFKFKKIL